MVRNRASDKLPYYTQNFMVIIIIVMNSVVQSLYGTHISKTKRLLHERILEHRRDRN